jgi:hypothetical protein
LKKKQAQEKIQMIIIVQSELRNEAHRQLKSMDEALLAQESLRKEKRLTANISSRLRKRNYFQVNDDTKYSCPLADFDEKELLQHKALIEAEVTMMR